jgi:hypothetical protein
MTAWIEKLFRRILTLEPGCYIIVLTVDGDRTCWSIQRVGKTER